MIQTRYLCGCSVVGKGPEFCAQHNDPVRFYEEFPKEPEAPPEPPPKKKAPTKKKK
jgi:hypothetical protein